MITQSCPADALWAEGMHTTSHQSSSTTPELDASSASSSEDSSLSSISNTPSLTSQDFIIAKVIGRGSSGVVYLAQHASGSSIHAVKVLRKSRLNLHSRDALILNEQRITKKLVEVGSPFFLPLHASFHDTENFYLVTRFFAAGDLAVEIRSILIPFAPLRVKFYMAELVHAISVLHNLRIIHRDIKLQNIFIDTDGHIVLGDFGLSRMFDESESRSYDHLRKDELKALTQSSGHSDHTRHWCGTVGYMAPELYSGLWYTYSADIWSLGIVMFEMLFNGMPWNGDCPRQVIESTLSDPLTIPDELPIDDDARDLLYSLLSKHPLDRPSLDTIKKHPYFADINWKHVANRKLKCHWSPNLPKSVQPFADKNGPLVIRTGFSYVGTNDPIPSFTYIAPSAQYLVNDPDEHQLTAMQSVLRSVKAVFGSRKLYCLGSPSHLSKHLQLAPINTSRRVGTCTNEPPRTPVMDTSPTHSKPRIALPSSSSIPSTGSPRSIRTFDSGLGNFTRAVKVKTGWTPSAKVRQGSDRRIINLLE